MGDYLWTEKAAMKYVKTLNDKKGCAEDELPRPRVSLQYEILAHNIFPLQTEIAHEEQG